MIVTRQRIESIGFKLILKPMNWMGLITVIEIQDAGHMNCLFEPQCINERVKWVDLNRGR